MTLAPAGRGAGRTQKWDRMEPQCVFDSRRFRGSCRNPDEVHGTPMAPRQFPIHFSVGTDPDKKATTLPRDRPTNKDKGLSQPAANRSIWLWRAPGLHVRVNQSSLYSENDVQPDSFLQMCVQCMASGCRFLTSLTARRSTGQSRPPPQTQTAGWV